ncbi:MAG TPA: bacterioferritin [Acidimicrobiia bacterium]
MHGDADVIELLNQVLTAELTATNQYFVDSKMAANWGYERLAQHFRDESIDEMKDADALIERIIYLEGTPNVQRLGTIRIGETIPEKLQLALDLERDAIERLSGGIALCTERSDHGTRDVLEHVLSGEERHADWLETQLTTIAQVGAELYLSQQIHD